MKALESPVGCSDELVVAIDVESSAPEGTAMQFVVVVDVEGPAPEPWVRVHTPPSSRVDDLSGHVVLWPMMMVAVDPDEDKVGFEASTPED